MEVEKFIFTGDTPPYEPTRGGIGFEIFRSMQIFKDNVAEIIIESGESCTYGDLLERSIRLALHLVSKNLKKEDVVCLCCYNQMNIAVPFYAAKFIDVNYASVEPGMPEEDLIYLLDYLKPKVLFVDESVEEKIEKCLKRANHQTDIIVFGKSEKNVSLHTLLEPVSGEENFTAAFVEDLMETAVIFFSSGTTGKPKGICCNHYSLLAQTVNISHCLSTEGVIDLSNYRFNLGGADENDKGNVLLYVPLYWISGIGSVLMSVVRGATRTIGASFNSETAWEAIEKYKPTTIFLPPGQVVDLYLKRNHNRPDNNLKVFLTGGGPVKSVHLKYMNEMFPKAFTIQLLGMTELTSIVTSFYIRDPRNIELQKKYPGSCGMISYGISCKIVDLDTERVCGFNEQGELRIKSRYVMNGYYKMDSSSAFDAEGWFKTGDLAFINEDKCLTIVDRIKEILLYTVYNIRPSVIEDILAKHPAVYDSFVVGVPHIEDNEHPMGVVVLKEEYRNQVSAEEIITFVNERVPADRYKIRAGIKFVEHMIKTPTGKVKKLAMKNLILEGKL